MNAIAQQTNETETSPSGKILEALFAIAAEVPAIGKDSENTQQHYNFRSADAIMAGLKPLLVKHRVLVYPVEILDEESGKGPKDAGFRVRQRIVYRFEHIDGSFRDAIVTGEGVDYGDKSCNKVMTVSLKYVLGQMFFIPYYSEDDPDKQSPEMGPQGGKPGTQPASKTEAKPAEAKKLGPMTALVAILNRKGFDTPAKALKWMGDSLTPKRTVKTTKEVKPDEVVTLTKLANAIPEPGSGPTE